MSVGIRRGAALLGALLLHWLFLFLLPQPSLPILALLVRILTYLLPAALLWLAFPLEKEVPSGCVAWQLSGAFGCTCVAALLVFAAAQLWGGGEATPTRSVPLLVSLLLAGVLEELFYRGAVLPLLSPLGSHLGVWLTAACFAVGHDFPLSALFAFLCGGVLGYLRLFSGRLLPCVLLHLLVNGLSYLLLPARLWVQGSVYGAGALLGGVCLWIALQKTKKEQEKYRDTGSDLYDPSLE